VGILRGRRGGRSAVGFLVVRGRTVGRLLDGCYAWDQAGQPTMCLLVGSVDIARLKVAGAVRAMSLWHWKESIVLLGARIVDMLCDGPVCT
jgi:hypothetical protein